MVTVERTVIHIQRFERNGFVPIECKCGKFFFRAEVGSTGVVFVKCEECRTYGPIDLTERCKRMC